MELISILLLVFPLLGFLTIGLFQKQMNRNLSGVLASSFIFLNLVAAAFLFGFVTASNQTLEVPLFDWIKFADITIPFALTIDRVGTDATYSEWCGAADTPLFHRIYEGR